MSTDDRKTARRPPGLLPPQRPERAHRGRRPQNPSRTRPAAPTIYLVDDDRRQGRQFLVSARGGIRGQKFHPRAKFIKAYRPQRRRLHRREFSFARHGRLQADRAAKGRKSKASRHHSHRTRRRADGAPQQNGQEQPTSSKDQYMALNFLPQSTCYDILQTRPNLGPAQRPLQPRLRRLVHVERRE